MVDRFLNYFALALIALFGISIYSMLHYRDNARTAVAQIKTLTEGLRILQEQRKIDSAVLVARQAEIASQRRKLAAAQAGLETALQANKTWSDTDVPPDVQKALVRRSGGPAGASGGVLSAPEDNPAAAPH